MIAVQVGAGLAGHADFDHLFRDWLIGCETLGEARRELQVFLDAGAPPVAGRIWSDAAWRESWLGDFLADLPGPADRNQARQDVDRLAAGQAEVVITGQQPGFLGGPLQTLDTVAAPLVLAELRSAAGRATIPVFWCADDDDDLREALQPVAWDPNRGVLLHHAQHGQRDLANDRMIGDLPAAEIDAGAVHLLQELAERNGLARDLAAIWRTSLDSGHSWSRVQRRAILRVFRERGLLVVHGNDPLLHAAAAPFYEQIWRQRSRLREAARSGARQLAAAGYAAAVTEPSIQRFLHCGRDGRRHPLSAEHAGRLPPAAELRPGVVARSCVQDWLFSPAGVVVGPGEAAYLKQLAPVYAVFALPRAPLLPRLFAQAGPTGHGEFQTWALELADRDRPGPESELATAAMRVAALPRTELMSVLHHEGCVVPARLPELADQVQNRWGRYLISVLRRELRRRREDAGAGQPLWLRPEGRRQERALAAFAAAALWGDHFCEAVVHACRRHVDAGLDGDWREYLLTVGGG